MSDPPPPPTLRQTSRNKSSSSLASHARSRPKRNKSSSSLAHAHPTTTTHAHPAHSIQFTHHSKPAKKRTTSHNGRKPFDLAFTAVKPGAGEARAEGEGPARREGEGEARSSEEEEEGRVGGQEDEEELEEQAPGSPMPQLEFRRTASSQGLAGHRAKGKMERTFSHDSAATVTVGTPLTFGSSLRNKPLLPPPEPPRTVLGSVQSVNEGSEWESATDSPNPPPRKASQGRLGQRQEGRDGGEVTQTTPSKQRSRSRGKARFEIGRSVSDDNVLGTGDRLPLASPNQHVTQANEGGPAFPFPKATTPPKKRKETQQSVGFPTTSPARLPAKAAVTSPAPPPPQSAPPQIVHSPPPDQPVPFPTVAQTSPVHPQDRYRAGGRKASNASIMSTTSVRSNALSMASRRGPPSTRRSASGAGPRLDTQHVAAGEVSYQHLPELTSAGGSHPPPVTGTRGGAHRRADSVGSMRSLRSVVEASGAGHPRRAATLSMGGRNASGSGLATSGSSSALSMLGQIAGGRDASPLGGPPKRSASGYFSAALRGLANIPGLTPPLASSPVPVSHMAAHSTLGPAGGNKGKGRAAASPQLVAPIVSRFTDDEPTPRLPAPATHPSHAGRIGAGAPSGAMSRTQQKALLARDAPFASSASELNLAKLSAVGPAKEYYHSLAGGQASAGAESTLRDWAMALVKDAEWIERQHRATCKWRDPVGESLERVLARRKGEGKGRGLAVAA